MPLSFHIYPTINEFTCNCRVRIAEWQLGIEVMQQRFWGTVLMQPGSGWLCAFALSCLVNLLLHERCELLFAVHVQLGVDAAGVGSDGVDGHHFAVGDFLGGPPARQA